MPKRPKKKIEAKKDEWLYALFLFVAVVLAYTPVWWAGYIWDDATVVTANPVVVGPLGLWEIWTTQAADICPFTLTTFWLEHKCWGVNPLPYHVVNVLMHGACAVVLWRVLLSLRISGAWLGATLWALHPVQVESVAWVSEMKNSESGLFFLLAILFYVKSLQREKAAYGLTLLFAVLAMASKSSTVVLPVILGLCAWWMEGRWHWRNAVRLAPLFVLSVIAGLVTMWTQRLQVIAFADVHDTRTFLERLIIGGDAIWFYLGKLLWPQDLITVYPRWVADSGAVISYLPLLAVVVVLVVFWIKRHSWGRGPFFALAFFLVALLPVLGLLDNAFSQFSYVADHFQYLASMGPLALIGAGVVVVMDRIGAKERWLPFVPGGVLILVLGLLSWSQAWIYQDQKALWSYTLARNSDSWVAHNNLGDVLYQEGRWDDAIAQYEQALRIRPDYAVGQNNLGYALDHQGNPQEAMPHYAKALELDPKNAVVHQNMGNLLFRAGRTDEAIEQYRTALAITPGNASMHNGLGAALAQKGRGSDALAEFEEALRLKPDLQEAKNNSAIVRDAMRKSGK